MPYQYITINVPVGASPFRTKETPQTIVGGYIEKMNITSNYYARVHPLFCSPESNPDSYKRYQVIDKILRLKSMNKSIWLNENGRVACSPNLSFIRVTPTDCEPVFGDVCIRMTVNQWNKLSPSLQEQLPHFDTYEEAMTGGNSRDAINSAVFETN